MASLAPLLVIWLLVGSLLAVIDIREHRLPDRIVLPMYGVVLGGLLLAGLLSGHWPIVRILACAAIWLGAIGAVWLVSAGRAMGFGDVKLAPLLGATLGAVSWDAAVLGLMSCWLVGGAWAIGLLVAGRARVGTAIAFGPFMILGMWVGLLLVRMTPIAPA